MNRLVIASGSNLGNSLEILATAQARLTKIFGACESSRVYRSSAVDYLDQPDFFNQILVFALPKKHDAEAVLQLLLEIESDLGREREILRGPRTIDLDLIFFANQTCDSPMLSLPHPRFLQRSFVIRPMLELSIASWVTENFAVPEVFTTEAFPIDD